jgi:hypothetical protein
MAWKDKEYKKEYMRKFSARPDQVAKRKAWQTAHRGKLYKYQRAWYQKDPQNGMIVRGRSGAKVRGIEFTITRSDLHWPKHCPVLGMELDYSSMRGSRRDNWPTLDRWDNSKGYVPGNVFVISWRANRIKWHCSPEELEAVARYAKYGLTSA